MSEILAIAFRMICEDAAAEETMAKYIEIRDMYLDLAKRAEAVGAERPPVEIPLPKHYTVH